MDKGTNMAGLAKQDYCNAHIDGLLLAHGCISTIYFDSAFKKMFV